MAEITVRSLSEQVVDGLLKLVDERKLEAGDRLPTEKELSELFGVGRSTIREAIVQLQNLGVLSVQQGKGTFLRKISATSLLKNQDPFYKFVDLERNELRDVMDVRKLLEREIVKLVTNRITEQGLKELRKCHQKYRTAQDPLLAYELDLEFHMLLARLSGNSILPLTLSLVNNFLDRFMPIMARTLELPEYAEKILEQHRQILLAIEAGDEKRATSAMLRHLNTSQMNILASFDIFAEQRRLKLV